MTDNDLYAVLDRLLATPVEAHRVEILRELVARREVDLVRLYDACAPCAPLIAAAVEREREECAQVAEREAARSEFATQARIIVRGIRARGGK